MSGGKDWNNLDGGSGKPHTKQGGKPDLQELMRRRFQNRPASAVSDSDNNASPTPLNQPVSGGAFRPVSQRAHGSSRGQTATDNNGNFVYENHFENSGSYGSAVGSNTDQGHGIKHQKQNDQRGGQSSQAVAPEVFENNFEDMEPAGASGSQRHLRNASGGSQSGVRTGYKENLGYPGRETEKTKDSPVGRNRDTHGMAQSSLFGERRQPPGSQEMAQSFQFGERRQPPGSQAHVHFGGLGGMGGVSGAAASPEKVPRSDTAGEGGAEPRRSNYNKYSADPMAQLMAFAQAHDNDSDSEETKKKREEEEKKVLDALAQGDPDFVNRLKNSSQNKQQEENDGMIRFGRGGRDGGFSMQGVGDIDEKELKEIMRGKDGKSGLMGEDISEEKMIELSQEMMGFGHGKKENKDNQNETMDQMLGRLLNQGGADKDGKADPVLQMLAGMGAGQVEEGEENPMTNMLNEAHRMGGGQGQDGGRDDGGDPFAQLLGGMRGQGQGQDGGGGGGGDPFAQLLSGMRGRGQGGRGGDPFAGMGGMGAGQGGRQGGNPADPMAQLLGGMRGRGGGQGSNPANPFGPLMARMGGGQGGNQANPFGQMMAGMGGMDGEGAASTQGSGGSLNEDELLAQTMSGMSQGENGQQGGGQHAMREDPIAQMLGGMRGRRQGGPDRNAMAGLMGGGGQGGPNMNMLAQMMGGGGLAGRGGGGNAMSQMMGSLMGGAGPGGGGGNPMAQLMEGMMGRGGGGGVNPMQLMAQMSGGGMGRGGNDDQMAALAQMMGRGRGQMMEEDEVIDIENPKEDQIIQQMLGYEMMKAVSCRDLRSDGMCTVIILDTSCSMTGEPIAEAGRFISEFINGLEESQFEYGLEENVAIICVGAQEHVAQHLTCDYTSIRRVIDSQFAEGPSRLHHGLILPIAVLTNRDGRDFIANIDGHRVCPRVILISDGHVNSREDVPGQNPPKGDQETLMLQNICVELTQNVTQRTMCTIHCVPVGDANIDFLETLANSTGGQLIQPKDAKKISRCYLHHYLVGLLRKDGKDTSDRSVVAANINQALACSDDEDVNSVMKIIGDGEPNIQAHEQALAKEMTDLQPQMGQGQGGMQGMQRMMGQPGGGGLPGMMGGGGGRIPAMFGGVGGGMSAMMGGGSGRLPAMMGGGGGRIPALMRVGKGGLPSMMGGRQGAKEEDGAGLDGGNENVGNRQFKTGDTSKLPSDVLTMMGLNKNDKPGKATVMKDVESGHESGRGEGLPEMPQLNDGRKPGGNDGGMPDMSTMMGGLGGGRGGGGPDGMPDLSALLSGLGGGRGGAGGMPNMPAMVGGGRGGSGTSGMPDMSAMMGGGRGGGGMGGLPDMSTLLSGLGGRRGGGGGNAGGLPDMSTIMGGLGGRGGGGNAGGLPDMSAMMGGLGGRGGGGNAGGLPDMSAMMGGLGGRGGGGNAGGLPGMSAMMGGLGGRGGGGNASGLPDMSAMMGGLGGRGGGGNAGGLPDLPPFLGGRRSDNMPALPVDGGGGGMGEMSEFSINIGGGDGRGGAGAGNPRMRYLPRRGNYGLSDIENMLKENKGGKMGDAESIEELMKHIDESTGYNRQKGGYTDTPYEDDDAMSISTISTADDGETAITDATEDEDDTTNGPDDEEHEGDIAARGADDNVYCLADGLFGKGRLAEKKSEYSMETLQELLMCIQPENFKGNADSGPSLSELLGQGKGAVRGGQAGNADMQGMDQGDQGQYQHNSAVNRQSYQPPQQDAQRPSTMGAESGFPQPQRASGQYQQQGQIRQGQGQGGQGYGRPQPQFRPGQYGQARGQQGDNGYDDQEDMNVMEEPD